MPRTLSVVLSCAAAVLAGCAGVSPAPRGAAEPGAVAALDRFGPGPCNPSVAAALAGAGIPVSQVRGLTYGLYRGTRHDRITGYDAWVKLAGQPGAVVVGMDATCHVRQVYAREGARLPDSGR